MYGLLFCRTPVQETNLLMNSFMVSEVWTTLWQKRRPYLRVLADEDHGFPMIDPVARDPLAHRNPCLGQLIQNGAVARVCWICPRVDDHSDSHSRAVPANQLGGVSRVRHEPEAHVDRGRFGADETQKRSAAVFVGKIAQSIGC
jgi:hypothetical protein